MLKSMQPVTFPVNCTRSIYTFHQGQRGPATTESEPYCKSWSMYRDLPSVLVAFEVDVLVFEPSLETLNPDVAQSPALSVHANLNASSEPSLRTSRWLPSGDIYLGIEGYEPLLYDYLPILAWKVFTIFIFYIVLIKQFFKWTHWTFIICTETNQIKEKLFYIFISS